MNVFSFLINSLRSEYYLADYIYKVGNFNLTALSSTFNPEGYYDAFNFSAEDLGTSTSFLNNRNTFKTTEGDFYEWDFIFFPNCGFLANNEPLPKDCELKLSFDRASPYNSILKMEGSAPDMDEPIVIKDVVATTEYISSPHWRDYFSSIDQTPAMFKYDECEVMIKNIPSSETELRFDNLRGGNTPQCLFVGILPQSCLQGDKALSSTYFTQNNVKEMNITLNGNSVNGYPISVRKTSPIQPYTKFLDVTHRLYNVCSSDFLNFNEFKKNWIWSHSFESESTSQGWIGINFKLSKAYTTNMALVCWIIAPSALTIDKFGAVERINL